MKHLEEGMMYSLRHPSARGPHSLQMMPIPIIPENVEEDSNEEEDPRFRAYSPSAYMHNVDLSQDDALEFPDLPHRRCGRTSSSLDLGETKVGREFSNNDSFLGALKQHSIMNGVNYNVVKSKSDKFEAKCAVQDNTCVSQDHPKMDSDMLASLILLTVKVDPKTSVSVLIANIRSQLKYTPSYRKVWITKQKALEKMYSRWDASRYEISKDRFHEMLAVLCSVNEEGADYFCNILFKQWTQAYDSSLRYSHMTSNLAECINFVLKGTHHFPITAVVRETYFCLATLFPKRAASYKGQMQEDPVWCAKVLREINKAKARANTMHIVCHDHDNLLFRVTKFDRPNQCIIGGQYHVRLRNRTSDYG
ncbi:hypothetical protein PVK06_011345 [Gossypium arboreum]|uniref:Uncharacterized protein n=1 Tax=Gossypium arboreum TaxID=29729 RepID=A0ABR0Q8V8_GOSAR|nr:hypothetical protein PVK06_011345 [Gossypium arboreum]